MITDTDNDGIADFFEMNGMYLPNASLIKTDYQNPDTDGDGLLDGEEIDTEIKTIRYSKGDKHYFLYCSYPDNVDSDGDMYNDYAEIVQHASNPLKSDVEKYSLSTDYTSVDLSTSALSYGGNQGWWGSNAITYEYKKDLEETGCGTIAACDIILYLNKIGIVDTPVKITYNTDGSISQKDYMDFVEYFYTTYRKNLIVGTLLPTWIVSVSQILDSYLYTYSDKIVVSRYLYDVTPLSSLFFKYSNPNDLLQNAISNIKKDSPIIILNPTNTKIFMFDSTMNIMNHPNNLISSSVNNSYFYYHYVTITEIIVDDIMEDSILKISSWGKEWYIYYSDFIRTSCCGMITATIV